MSICKQRNDISFSFSFSWLCVRLSIFSYFDYTHSYLHTHTYITISIPISIYLCIRDINSLSIICVASIFLTGYSLPLYTFSWSFKKDMHAVLVYAGVCCKCCFQTVGNDEVGFSYIPADFLSSQSISHWEKGVSLSSWGDLFVIMYCFLSISGNLLYSKIHLSTKRGTLGSFD